METILVSTVQLRQQMGFARASLEHICSTAVKRYVSSVTFFPPWQIDYVAHAHPLVPRVRRCERTRRFQPVTPSPLMTFSLWIVEKIATLAECYMKYLSS